MALAVSRVRFALQKRQNDETERKERARRGRRLKIEIDRVQKLELKELLLQLHKREIRFGPTEDRETLGRHTTPFPFLYFTFGSA
jgi:hypothetical protein